MQQTTRPPLGTTLLTYARHYDHYYTVAWSPDSTYLASACPSEVLVWEALTGKIVTTCQHKAARRSALPGRLMAAAAYASIIYVWNAESGQTITIYRGHRQKVYPLAWSPDSTMIASAQEGGSERGFSFSEDDENNQSQPSALLPARPFICGEWDRTRKSRTTSIKATHLMDASPHACGTFAGSLTENASPLPIVKCRSGKRVSE